MLHESKCPICNYNSWDTISAKQYSKADYKKQSPYVKLRYNVLFDIWLPDQKCVEFKTLLCKECSFVMFTPRPSEEDLIKKYLYLGQNPDSIHEPTEHRESDNKRSEELYLYLKPYIKSRARILDFGGGNGRLMSVFIEKKHQCSLIDYCDKPIEGISRLGETLDDINTDNKFDIIICSHVLEHLADPMLTLKKLKNLITENGLIYIEVPLELKDCIPPFQEPVTHINFFSTCSLKALAELSGLHVFSCVESQFTTEQNTKNFALKLVAHKSDIILNSQSKISPIDKNAYRETLKLIFPSISEKATRFLKDQKYRHRKINEMGKKYLPKKFFWRFFN